MTLPHAPPLSRALHPLGSIPSRDGASARAQSDAAGTGGAADEPSPAEGAAETAADAAAADAAADEDGSLTVENFEEVQETALASIVELFESFVSHIPYVLGAIVVLSLTWLLTRAIDAFGQRLLGHWKKRESVKELILRLAGLTVTLLGFLLAAIVLFPGLTPAKALGGLGLVSIAVGLAFKDIFENFFAGILILWRFPFERGDFIECEGLVGRVERVLVRMSYIRKTTGELVVVPNAFLFKSPVTVLTSLERRRVTVMAGVAYGEDVATAVGVIERAVEACESVLERRPIEIFPQGFGSSSIDIEVTWWTGSTPLEVRRSRGEVVTAVKRALDEAGIEIPFPYRTLTFKEPLPIAQPSPREPQS